MTCIEPFFVGSDGFEPPKALPIDLQSTPFGHSGNSPEIFEPNHRFELWTPRLQITCSGQLS